MQRLQRMTVMTKSNAQTEEIQTKCMDVEKKMIHYQNTNHGNNVMSKIEMPHIFKPVDPVEFAERLRDILIDYNESFVVSEKMIDVFHGYASTFNSVVRDNQNPKEHEPSRYIVPLATGSAKSTAAKLFLSMADVPGILIVRTAMNAVEAARDINKLSGRDIARCTYSVDAKNGRPEEPERVAASELSKYQVIILTHAMFQRLHRSEDFILDLYKLFDGTEREAIIIDERIDLKREENFTNGELLEAIKFLRAADKSNKFDPELTALFNLNDIVFTHKARSDKSRFTMWKADMIDYLHNACKLIATLKRAITGGELHLVRQHEIRGLRGKDSDVYTLRNSILDLLDRVEFVISGRMMLSQEGRNTVATRVEDFSLVFGSTTILDATANVNKSYEVYQMYQAESTIMFDKPEIRSYKNASLHVANGFKQSKYALYDAPRKKHGAEAMAGIVNAYLDLLYPVVDEHDQMLVVVHKDALETFKTQCRVDNITFINWGNHAGSNKWSHYNKAAVIGWFRLPPHVYANQINAGAKDYTKYVPEKTYDLDVQALADSAIADDMVQFFNRIRSRIAIDKAGNHEPVDYYMFSDNTERSESIISRMCEEFPYMTTLEWKVAPATSIKKKKLKSEERIDSIIEILKSEAKTKLDVMAEDIRSRLGTTKSAFSRILKNEYFIKECEWFGIKSKRLEKVKGKPLVFDLSEAKHL